MYLVQLLSIAIIEDKLINMKSRHTDRGDDLNKRDKIYPVDLGLFLVVGCGWQREFAIER